MNKLNMCVVCGQFPKEPGFERCLLCLKKIDSPVKEYPGLISGRIAKWRDQRKEKNKQLPATKEEIEQLKLERDRAVLQKDIAVANAKAKESGSKRNGWDIFHSIVGTSSPANNNHSRRSKSDGFNKASKILDKASGKNNDKDYSALTG